MSNPKDKATEKYHEDMRLLDVGRIPGAKQNWTDDEWNRYLDLKESERDG